MIGIHWRAMARNSARELEERRVSPFDAVLARADRRVDAFMSIVQQDLWVSHFAAAEVASALSRLVRIGRLQATDGAACLSDFDVWRAAMTRHAEIHAVDVRLSPHMSSDLIWLCGRQTRCTWRSRGASTSRWSHSIGE
jgi:hypothetical protein